MDVMNARFCGIIYLLISRESFAYWRRVLTLAVKLFSLRADRRRGISTPLERFIGLRTTARDAAIVYINLPQLGRSRSMKYGVPPSFYGIALSSKNYGATWQKSSLRLLFSSACKITAFTD